MNATDLATLSALPLICVCFSCNCRSRTCNAASRLPRISVIFWTSVCVDSILVVHLEQRSLVFWIPSGANAPGYPAKRLVKRFRSRLAWRFGMATAGTSVVVVMVFAVVYEIWFPSRGTLLHLTLVQRSSHISSKRIPSALRCGSEIGVCSAIGRADRGRRTEWRISIKLD